MPKVEFKDFKDEVWWQFEVNGTKLRAVKKKTKFGDLTEKTYLYTDSEGGSYYSTTALAIFSQKHWLEKLLGVSLKVVEV